MEPAVTPVGAVGSPAEDRLLGLAEEPSDRGPGNAPLEGLEEDALLRGGGGAGGAKASKRR
eukprot:5827218-Alexandrium_andersonii.AAC.1